MERKDVEARLKWDTSAIFKDDKAWEECYNAVLPKLDFSSYQGKLKEKETILSFVRKMEEVAGDLEKLYLYSHMNHDVDTRDATYNSMQARAMTMYVQFSSSISFVESELVALPDEVLDEMIADPDFSDYDYQFKLTKKQKAHILSKEEEKLLAMSGDAFSSFSDVFSMINNADLPKKNVTFEGRQIPLSFGLYSIIMSGEDRELRKDAYEKLYSSFRSLLNTITATYFGNVKKDVFYARARHYDSCLQMALANEDVSECVYKNLLESVDKGVGALHRFIDLRKKVLGYDKLHMYDIYAPLVGEANMKLSFDEAYDLVIESLSVLGEDYQNLLRRARDERWIDVCETEGKKSGAYSTGCYGVHPYVLLNYQPTIDNVSTIAHEMGHAMHTYFANANQPQNKAGYRIFVAEVASTVNEVLLTKHIIATTKDEQLKKSLLNHYLDTIRGTLFRQTMFAEFEYIAHDMVEKGIPLTHENLSEKYLELNKKYYGDSIIHDENIAIEWARIPHFYTSFYVYKYATGIISAISIAKRILTEGDKARKDYFAFLSSGGSDSPVELLKIAGVDLTKKDAFDVAMKEFEDSVKELEKVLGY